MFDLEDHVFAAWQAWQANTQMNLCICVMHIDFLSCVLVDLVLTHLFC